MDQLYAEIISGSLAPVLLISGAGLLALSIQNRYGRVIDRIRNFDLEMRSECSGTCLPEAKEKRKKSVSVQTKILRKRGKYLRNALFFLFLAALFASLTSVVVFLSLLMGYSGALTLALFSLGLLSLITGMLYAILDVALSYRAIELEIDMENLIE